MSSRTSTQPKKRKRSSDYSSKNEPAVKKVRRSKSVKLEKDHSIETQSNRKKSTKSTGKLNHTITQFFGKNQSYFKPASEINNNISATYVIPTRNIKMEVESSISSDFENLSTKIVNSEHFKRLRELRVYLDRTAVENYFRKKSMSKNHAQTTLDQFLNFNIVSKQNRAIDRKVMLPLISKIQEIFDFQKLSKIKDMKVKSVKIRVKDMVIHCDITVKLDKLLSTDGLQIKNETTSPENNFNSIKALKKFNDYDPQDWIKTEIAGGTSIHENLARIKIQEDDSQNLTTTTDENSMQMEVSDESQNLSWSEKCQPSFDASKIERMSSIKITDALTAMSKDSLLSIYDECLDAPMEVEMDTNEILQNTPDAFDINFINSGSSFNSSRHSWPISDESGIFMSDDSANFNELSSKFIMNNSFNGFDSHRE